MRTCTIGGHLECVRLLLQHGADVNPEFVKSWTPLTAALASTEHGDGPDTTAEIVKLLLEHGADWDRAEVPFGLKPLHWAASMGNIECMR